MAWLAERQPQASQAVPVGSGRVAAPCGEVAGGDPIGATLRMLINSGGDDRIAIDPASDRTSYGTPAIPAPHEIWLSSSTASAVSPRGFEAAGHAVEAVFGRPGRQAILSPETWLARSRQRLLAQFGIPGAEVILTASGTETELVALTLARAVLDRQVLNIVLAPTETGSGVTKAAAGQHFLAMTNSGEAVLPGTALAGWSDAGTEVAEIAIRDADGRPRPAGDIDRHATIAAVGALRSGRDVLLHVLATSKTGLEGLTRETALDLATEAHGRLLVVVDACQLRSEPDAIRADLRAGFMVMVTGSKFAGGPPFCGALLVPPWLAARLSGAASRAAPHGLAHYSTALDWPDTLRPAFAAALAQRVNFGAGLRWEAALAEIESYFALPCAIRTGVANAFADAVAQRIAHRPFLVPLDIDRPPGCRTIVPVVGRGALGHPTAAATIHRRMRDGPRACHLGQPVKVGDRAALRFCLSMPHVVDAAARMKSGATFEQAMAPIAADIDTAIDRWDAIAHTT